MNVFFSEGFKRASLFLALFDLSFDSFVQPFIPSVLAFDFLGFVLGFSFFGVLQILFFFKMRQIVSSRVSAQGPHVHGGPAGCVFRTSHVSSVGLGPAPRQNHRFRI